MRGLLSVAATMVLPALILSGASGLTAQETYLFVIGGVGGDPEYRTQFHQLSVRLIDAVEAAGLPSDHITYLNERPARDPRIGGESRRENLEAEFDRLAGIAGTNDQLFVVLIGHGSARQTEALFNLPGPDLSAVEFDALLDKFNVRQIVFVNTTSASGEFVAALTGPGRIVVTATRSGNERNLTKFPEFFVAAYAEGGADTDKNGRVSVAEAFEYTRQEVTRSYERENHIATEHPLLDDDGDGEGSGEIVTGGSDGSLARVAYLTPVQAVLSADMANDPELVQLLQRKAALEAQVQALRELRDSTDPTEYQRQLEAILVELALTNREIREKGGDGS